jgi:hypothetical protein
MLALFLIFVPSLASACTDSYPNPSDGGQWCSSDGGVLSDGENCWGDCLTGCPTMDCDGCSVETTAVSTQADCIWPANTKLCCAHVPYSPHSHQPHSHSPWSSYDHSHQPHSHTPSTPAGYCVPTDGICNSLLSCDGFPYQCNDDGNCYNVDCATVDALEWWHYLLICGGAFIGVSAIASIVRCLCSKPKSVTTEVTEMPQISLVERT